MCWDALANGPAELELRFSNKYISHAFGVQMFTLASGEVVSVEPQTLHPSL